jgi:hypothetical protein
MLNTTNSQLLIKGLLVIGLLFTPIVFDKPTTEKWVCHTWQWSGSVYNRKVYCVQWVKRDCSVRLYKDICKYGG